MPLLKTQGFPTSNVPNCEGWANAQIPEELDARGHHDWQDKPTTRPDGRQMLPARKAPASGMAESGFHFHYTQHEEPTEKTGGSPFVRTLYFLEPGVLIVPVKVPECES